MKTARLAAVVPILLWGICVFVLSCSGGGNGSNDGGQDGQDGDGGDDGDGTHVPAIRWSERMEVDLEQAGLQLDLAATPDNQFAIGYINEGVLVENGCTAPITGGGFTPEMLDQVRYARFDGTAWTHEDVAPIKSVFLAGISLAFDPSGVPTIAYLGGPNSSQCCGGSNLIFATRTGASQWTETGAVTNSAQAGDGGNCPIGQNLCNVGDMVGLWPAIVKNPVTGALGAAYRDIHLCYAQSDQDFSDLEYVYTNGGGFGHEFIDLARGGGDFNSLTFDSTGEPAVATYNGKSGFIGFSRRQAGTWTPSAACSAAPSPDTCSDRARGDCPEGMTCIKKRCTALIDCVSGSLPDGSISLGVGKDGRFLVAYYDANQKSLRFGHSTDGLQWNTAIIDAAGSNGRSPNLLIDPQSGMPAVVYYRCSDSSSDSNCNRNHDGVRYAYFTGTYPDELLTTNKWKKVTVCEDSAAYDGERVSAAILPDGRIGVAYSYLCTIGCQSPRQILFQIGTWE
jgi:hypothetical protein